MRDFVQKLHADDRHAFEAPLLNLLEHYIRITNMRRSARLMFQFLLLVSLVCLERVVAAQSENQVWTSIGPEGGVIECLAIDPFNADTLYAGVNGAINPQRHLCSEPWRRSQTGEE